MKTFVEDMYFIVLSGSLLIVMMIVDFVLTFTFLALATLTLLAFVGVCGIVLYLLGEVMCFFLPICT